VTGPRRENFGEGFAQITEAILSLATRYPELAIVYPVHLNPNVQHPVRARLANLPNVLLTEPLDYPDFIFAMKNSWLILTDSGGVQEEAPSLGKPVLVMRDTTERPEALAAGTVQLVGAHCQRIVDAVADHWSHSKRFAASNPYGDGTASERIVSFLSNINL
jgi:UDP-N-acetylglucosamine 2-epimerase (non-hydrolysing)